MSEINGSDFSVNQIHFNNVKKKQNKIVKEEQKENDTPQLKVFSNPKAEALGRSMLFKGIDDTNHDLKTLLDNPQIAETSDKNFETISPKFL